MKAFELRAHVDSQPRVEVAQRFVEQQQLRAGCNRARDGDSLLLSAGEFVGITITILFNAHLVQRTHDALFHLVLGKAFDLEAEGDVFKRGHVRPKRVALEHEVEVALARGFIERFFCVDNRLAVHEHDAVLRFLEAGDDAKRGRLAAAGWPEQRHEITVVNREVDISQHMVVAVKFIDILQFDLAHC